MRVWTKETFGLYVIAGWCWTRFGIGVAIDNYSLTLDLGFLWIAIEK